MPAEPTTSWKRSVARAFGDAVAYESHARVQAVAAARLASAIAERPLAPAPRLLEIGCGTGLLTKALLDRIEPGPSLVTDLAPGMVARARARLGHHPALSVAVMDGELPAVRPGFDLIASSLAAQWFEDQPGALARLAGLLAPGGLLAVATLAAGTFREWDAALAAQGVSPAGRPFPPVETLADPLIPRCRSELLTETLVETHEDGLAFLRSLRAIGAQTPSSEEAGRSGRLRPALRAFEAGGARISYVLALCLIRRIT